MLVVMFVHGKTRFEVREEGESACSCLGIDA